MPNHYHHPADVLQFADKQMEPYALVVVTSITGGTMRAEGALMCVTGTGVIAGYISNGCVDADIIVQARQVIQTGIVKKLCYGDGSGFKDIKLPCGGRIDLTIIPNPPQNLIANAAKTLISRQSTVLQLGGISLSYLPKIQLRIVGRGEAVRSLAMQARQTGFDVIVQSPEEGIVTDMDITFQHLTSPSVTPALCDDPWTAVVLMFHDHEWEPAILAQALGGKAFYIGAMGSPHTHALRKKILTDYGLSQKDIARIRGPIGLIPSMRDANLLALSTLSEIVSIAQESGRL